MSYQTKGTGWTLTPRRYSNIQVAIQAHVANAAGRREDYAWLRAEQRLTREQAAGRLGISLRTAFRYDAQLEVAS